MAESSRRMFEWPFIFRQPANASISKPKLIKLIEFNPTGLVDIVIDFWRQVLCW